MDEIIFDDVTCKQSIMYQIKFKAAFTRDQCGSVPFGSDPLWHGFA